MLAGLKKDQVKMSKSMSDSAIFMEDSKADVEAKIKNAYCPEKIIAANPIVEYTKYIIFGSLGKFTVKRPEKYGGNLYKLIKLDIMTLMNYLRKTILKG
jgi:tyrosyl-tRNA synthetase